MTLRDAGPATRYRMLEIHARLEQLMRDDAAEPAAPPAKKTRAAA
jgi:hypothetical protein